MKDEQEVSSIKGQGSGFALPIGGLRLRLNPKSVKYQGIALALKLRLVGLLVLLTLPALACGFTPTAYQVNNEVRLAVYEYERQTRGLADDLVIDFQRDEPRLKFEGQDEHGGRTVWLFRPGAAEFFRLRPPQATYLYIQDIQYNNDRGTATVKVFRSADSGYIGRELTLQRDAAQQWRVTQEVEIERTTPE